MMIKRTYDAYGCIYFHIRESGHDVSFVDHNADISLWLDGDVVGFNKKPTFGATGITLKCGKFTNTIEYYYPPDPLGVISSLPDKDIVDIALEVFGHNIPTGRHPFCPISDVFQVEVTKSN